MENYLYGAGGGLVDGMSVDEVARNAEQKKRKMVEKSGEDYMRVHHVLSPDGALRRRWVRDDCVLCAAALLSSCAVALLWLLLPSLPSRQLIPLPGFRADLLHGVRRGRGAV